MTRCLVGMLAVAGAAHAEHGRGFLARYQLTGVTRPDAAHVHFTLHVLLSNHIGHPISRATLSLTAGPGDHRVVAIFPQPLTLGVRDRILVSAGFTVPAATYQRWQASRAPALWVDFPGAAGHPLHRPVDMNRGPLPGGAS